MANLALFTLLAIVVAALLLQFIAHPYFYSRGHAHPTRLPICCVTLEDAGISDYDDVTLTTLDGITLKGWYIPSTNGAGVITLHGIAGNRLGTVRHATMLAKHGYGILMVDLRAHGESGGDLLTFGADESNDVLAGIAYLQGHEDIDPERIGVLGLSLGAGFAVQAAARSDAIKAVVADGIGFTALEDMPPQPLFWRAYDPVFFFFLRWHTNIDQPVSLKESVANVSAPILFIGNGNEEPGIRMFDAVAPDSDVWIIEDADHINGIVDAAEDYELRLVEYFNTTLLGD